MFNFFNHDRSNSVRSTDRKSKGGAPARRLLRLESLEDRALLSVTAVEYTQLCALYGALNLPTSPSSINIIEITASNLSIAKLKDAIDLATTNPGNDLIVARTTNSVNTLTYRSGADSLAFNFDAETYGSVSIVSLGSQPLTLDANRVAPIGFVNSGTVAFGGMTFTNGYSNYAFGGGAFGVYGSLTLSLCTVDKNTAQGCGGAFANYGALTLSDCVVSNNLTGINGGGISCNGNSTTTLLNSSFYSNTSTNDGGGIYSGNNSKTTIANCTISKNKSNLHYGGGIYNDVNSTTTLSNCTVSDNTSEDCGGGIFNNGSMTLTSCAIATNVSAYGGGIAQPVYGSTRLLNCTVAGNRAAIGGGIYSLNSVSYLFNTIVSSNYASSSTNVYGTTASSSSHNIIDGAPGFVVPPTFDASGVLTNASSYNLRLHTMSRAINAGDNSYVSGNATDLNGSPRVSDGIVDIGAYEYFVAPSVPSITKTTPTKTSIAVTFTCSGHVSGDSYTLQYSKDSSFKTGVTTKSGYTQPGTVAVSGLESNTTYYFRVKHVSSGVSSDWSSVTSAKTLADSVVPSITKTTPTQTSIGVTITCSGHVSGDSYTLQYSKDSSFKTGVTTKSGYTQPGAVTVSGLESNTTYYFRVKHVSSGVSSDWSSVVPETTLPVDAAAPTLKKVAWTSDASIGVTFSYSGHVSGNRYTLQYSKDPDFVSGVASKTHTQPGTVAISGLTANTTYFFRIKCVSDGVSSAWSDVVSPGPSITKVVQSGTSASVTFGYPQHVQGSCTYTVQYSKDPDFKTGVLTKSGYTRPGVCAISGLESGVTYFFRVKMVSGGVSTTWSTIVPDASPVPSIVGTESTTTSIAVTFSYLRHASGDSYTLQYSKNANFSSGVVTRTYSKPGVSAISGLSPNTTYYFRVKNVSGGVSSDWSSVVSAKTKSDAPTPTVQKTSWTSDTSIGVTFAYPNHVSGNKYVVQCSKDPNFASGITSKTFTTPGTGAYKNLTPNTIYFFRAKCVFTNGTESEWSNVVSPTPSITKTVPSGASIAVTFAYAKHVKGSCSYTLQYSTDPTFESGVTTKSGYSQPGVCSVTGLTSGTTYYFRIKLVSGGVSSAWSEVVSEETLDGAPSISKTVSAPTSIAITFAYSKHASGDSYTLQYSKDASFASGVASKTYTRPGAVKISGLDGNTTYYFRVKRVADGVSSVWSNVVSAKTLLAPVVTKTTSTASSINVTFTYGEHVTGNSYVVQCSKDSSFANGVTSKTFTKPGTGAFAGLDSSTTYYIRVKSVSDGVSSAWSNVLSAKTLDGTDSNDWVENRWFYYDWQTDSAKSKEDLIKTLATAGELGFNGVVLNGNFDSARSNNAVVNDLKQIKAAADSAGIEIVPYLGATGCCSLLDADPNLAEGISYVDVPMKVTKKSGQAGVATFASDQVASTATVPNGGMEQTTYDSKTRTYTVTGIVSKYDGKLMLRDTQVKYSGSASGKIVGSDEYYCVADVQPGSFYRASCRVMIDANVDYASIKICDMNSQHVLCGDVAVLQRQADNTNQWIELVTNVFQAPENGQIRLYLGTSDSKGSAWFDDVKIEPVARDGLVDPLQRDGAPIVVTNVAGTIEYIQGVDWDLPGDYQLALYREQKLDLVIPAGSRIANGQVVYVDYYRPLELNNWHTSVCLTEERWYELFENAVSTIKSELNPKSFFLATDEIHCAGTCLGCQETGKSLGELLGNSVSRQYSIIKDASPNAEVYVWADMFDPNFNVKDYSYCINDFTGALTYLPKDITICCWADGRQWRYADENDQNGAWKTEDEFIKEGLRYFSSRGFRTMGAAFYDADRRGDTEQEQRDSVNHNIETWYDEGSVTDGCLGLLYATWADNGIPDYDWLDEFAQIVWGK